jgi:hypothetical protein
MNTLQTVITLIFLPTSIVGGIVFVLRKFFEQGLARDIAKYEATLNADLTQAKLRLEIELQTKFFEFQTKFSFYHQKQVDVIETLYEMLCETEWTVGRLVHPISPNDGRSVEDRVNEADEQSVALARLYGKKRIYLNDDVCEKMDAILKIMRKSVVTFSVGQMEPRNASADTRMWAEAWKVMEEEFPPLKEALEKQLKGILSVLSNTTTQQIVEPERNQLVSHSRDLKA